MVHRNSIIPKFAYPNEDKGYLSAQVSVRSMIQNNVERIMDFDDVRANLNSISNEGLVECVMQISAGPDSATGFSHYNQTKFVARDNSLFTEHFMSMKLESDSRILYTVPNPHWETFCRARLMSWTKETDVLAREMYDQFFKEIEDINEEPVIVKLEM